MLDNSFKKTSAFLLITFIHDRMVEKKLTKLTEVIYFLISYVRVKYVHHSIF